VKKDLVKTYFSAPNRHIVKNTNGEKVDILSHNSKYSYVNPDFIIFLFFSKDGAVEKAVDNVENSWLSTSISRYFPIYDPENPPFFSCRRKS